MLRITRHSNDWISWVGLLAFVPLAVAFYAMAIGFLVFGNLILKILAAAVMWFFRAAAWELLMRLFFPHELELVLDECGARFGRADRPERQHVMDRSTIRRIIHDSDGGQLLVDTGQWRDRPLGPEVLIRKQQIQEVLDYITSHWAEIPVVPFEVAYRNV